MSDRESIARDAEDERLGEFYERRDAPVLVECDCGRLVERERMGTCSQCGSSVCHSCRFDILGGEYLCPLCEEMLRLEIAVVMEQET